MSSEGGGIWGSIGGDAIASAITAEREGNAGCEITFPMITDARMLDATRPSEIGKQPVVAGGAKTPGGTAMCSR